jgi:hypothetical protein
VHQHFHLHESSVGIAWQSVRNHTGKHNECLGLRPQHSNVLKNKKQKKIEVKVARNAAYNAVISRTTYFMCNVDYRRYI